MERPDGSGSIVEVSQQSWLGRLRDAVSGIVVGLVLLLVASVMLFLNEGRSVRRAQALKEGVRTVSSLSDPAPNPERDGSLVHVVGRAVTNEVLEDSSLGVRAPALKLRRSVEMYQWNEKTETEERTKVGGGTEKVSVISYAREWSSSPVDSNSFKDPSGHQNPPFPISAQEWVASGITIGQLRLGDSLTSKLNRSETLAPDPATVERARGLLERAVVVSGDGLYVGSDPSTPQIGDLRITHSSVPPAEVSVVAALQGSGLETYRTTNRGTIALLQYGSVTADDMFAAARAGNRMLTWGLRFGGFVLFFLGFGAILRPLRVVADVVPPVGRLIGAGLGVVSLGLAAISTLVVIAVGWMFYRPLLAGALFALALGVLIWLFVRSARKRKEAAAETAKESVRRSPAGAPPPPAPSNRKPRSPPSPPPDLPPVPGT